MSVSAEDVVRACYRSLLMREPDRDGLDEHVRLLTTGAASVDDLLSSFINSVEFHSVSSSTPRLRAASDSGRVINDSSQFGEFSLLLKTWVNNSARHRLIVDIGARGRERSNSYDLLRSFGWKALLIEANPALISQIQLDFSELCYDLLNVAISDYDGSASFHIGVNDDVSSLAADAALAWGDILGTVNVQVKRLGPILLERSIPFDFDLLSLDIEGEDLKVLRDLLDSTQYRPLWIIIEASYNYKTKSLNELGVSKTFEEAYKIVGQTPANLVLQHVGLGGAF